MARIISKNWTAVLGGEPFRYEAPTSSRSPRGSVDRNIMSPIALTDRYGCDDCRSNDDRLARLKLESDFKYMRVRTFVLNGAPSIAWHEACGGPEGIFGADDFHILSPTVAAPMRFYTDGLLAPSGAPGTGIRSVDTACAGRADPLSFRHCL